MYVKMNSLNFVHSCVNAMCYIEISAANLRNHRVQPLRILLVSSIYSVKYFGTFMSKIFSLLCE